MSNPHDNDQGETQSPERRRRLSIDPALVRPTVRSDDPWLTIIGRFEGIVPYEIDRTPQQFALLRQGGWGDLHDHNLAPAIEKLSLAPLFGDFVSWWETHQPAGGPSVDDLIAAEIAFAGPFQVTRDNLAQLTLRSDGGWSREHPAGSNGLVIIRSGIGFVAYILEPDWPVFERALTIPGYSLWECCTAEADSSSRDIEDVLDSLSFGLRSLIHADIGYLDFIA